MGSKGIDRARLCDNGGKPKYRESGTSIDAPNLAELCRSRDALKCKKSETEVEEPDMISHEALGIVMPNS